MKILRSLLFLFTVSLGLIVSHVSHLRSQEHPLASPALDETTREAMWKYLNSLFPEAETPEGAQMFTAIFSGSQMGAGEGWFKSAETKYSYEWLRKNFGAKASESDDSPPILTKENMPNQSALFDVLDRNRDGQIQPFDLDWSDSNPYVEMSYMLSRVFRRIDPKGKGAISEEDWLKFFKENSQNGKELTNDEFTTGILSGFSAGFMPGDAPTAETLLKGFFTGEIGSMYEGPSVGDRAPLFELRKLKSEETIRLKALLGDKPIVLVFGNFTCGPFRGYYPAVDRLYEKYKDRAHFIMVYVREAHPTDGWKMQANTRVGVEVNQPTSFEDREQVASQFCERLDPKIPVVIDEVNDPTGHAYSGMPARLYVINPDGKVAYKSGRGPFGFKPPELEQALVMSLLEQQLVGQNRPKSAQAKLEKSVIVDEEARRLLPPIVEGSDLPIPNWAKAMVSTLPKTTAALLQLDYAHRTKNPLDPKLRAKVRYLIACLNRCDYSKRVAKADFLRCGGDLNEIESLTEDEATWSDSEADELRFAKLHTTDAPKIEDELFERLLEKHGEKKVAGLVVLGAYANFQDRLLLGLNIPPEVDDSIPPLNIQFDPSVFQTQPLLPSSSEYKDLAVGRIDHNAVTSDWSKVSYEELKKRLELQRKRQQRLPTPMWEDVARNLPKNYIAKPTRIVWNLVCLGYIPELATPWSMTTRTMWAEAPQDRVFEESLFWIQTRAINCNYCMGHCEMLLEVAGLNEEQMSSRLIALSSDQWNVFSEKEQRAFAYARKLSLTPWLLTQSEFEQLERDLGPREAMATFFWLCRGLYMTRVSDGFQLQLEADNVFADLDKTKK